MGRVLVFHMAGCGACSEYMPRLRRAAGPYLRRKLSIHPVDVNSAVGGRWAEKMEIGATPTTVVLDKQDRQVLRKVGNLDDAEIASLLTLAFRG